MYIYCNRRNYLLMFGDELLTLNESRLCERASGICAKPWTQSLPSHSHLITGQSAKYLHLATVNTEREIRYAQVRCAWIPNSLETNFISV
jgi:hypothetical protein